MKMIDIKGDIVTNDLKWIYDWLGYQSTCPKDVEDALRDANGDDVIIKINSPGGIVEAGSEIYTEIQTYAGNKKIQIVAMAASAASVIAMAGYCEMSPTALMMVHNVSSGVNGDYHDMEKGAEILKTYNKTIAAAYIHKTGMSEEEALRLMDEETYLDAESALQYGLIDKIMFTDKVNVNFDTLRNFGKLGYVNSVTNLSISEETIKSMKENQQKYADFFDEKKKAQVRLDLLKLGGKIHE